MSRIRVVCAVYWLFLTVLLLSPDPLELLGISVPATTPGGRFVHFLMFTVLAFLVSASRFPMRRGLLAGLLVAYALATETLQLFVPTRSVELLDYAENLLGLATGGVIWWLIRKRVAGRAP